MKPHKHAELIKLWADGAKIQYRYYMHTSSKGDIHSEWVNEENPDWNLDREYRIKPEPKPDVVLYALVHRVAHHLPCSPYASISSAYGQFPDPQNPANLKLIFDGETGELKSAEVLK